MRLGGEGREGFTRRIGGVYSPVGILNVNSGTLECFYELNSGVRV